jgi:phosphoribosyl 1,2-cyclic phosphate phosphodiesterase
MDASYIGKDERKLIRENAESIIINGLRMRPHTTHFSISESLFLIKSLKMKKGCILHLSHDLKHAELERLLPENISAGYDGMEFNA